MEALQRTVASPFVLVPALFLLLILSVVLLAVYCPRAEENQRLRKIIIAQHERIVELSEKSTAAQLEHEQKIEAMKGEYIADIGELTSELAAQRGRAEQNASRADQIARATERRSA